MPDKSKKDDSPVTEPVTGGGAVATTGGGTESFEDIEHLKKWILDCRNEAKHATNELRLKWVDLWELYRNEQDYTAKDDWQSKTCTPRLSMAVKRASLLIERAILQTNKLFELKLDDEFVLPLKDAIRQAKKQLRDAEEQAASLTRAAEQVMEQVQANQEAVVNNPQAEAVLERHREAISQANDAVIQAKADLKAAERELGDHEQQAEADNERFKARLGKTNFAAAYGEMLTPALLLGIGIIKRVLSGEEETITYEHTPAENLFIAPDYRPFENTPPRYLVEYKEMNLATLRDLAVRSNKQAEENKWPLPFIMEEVEKINEDYSKTGEERSQRLERLGLSEYTDVTKRVAVLEFWGEVVSKDGKEIQKDRLMMLANEQYLIRNQENPYEDKKPPYNCTIPLVYPGRGAVGISLIEDEKKLQWTLNNLLNLFIDSLTFTAFPEYEYDPQKLMEPENMMTTFPGRCILTKGDVNGPVVSQLKKYPIGSDAFRVYDIMTRELQEGTTITEFLTGMPGKQSKTLGEVEMKTTESHGYFDVIARKLEQNSAKPLLRDSYAMLQQFTETFRNLERYQFNVNGVSLLLMKKDEAQKLMQVIALGRQTQTASQEMLNALFERLLAIYNLEGIGPDNEPAGPQLATVAQPAAGPGPMRALPAPAQNVA